jgi:mannan endo-1,4-beta-mannosidase
LTGCGTAGQVPTYGEVNSFFASLRPNSIVRTWFFARMDIARLDEVLRLAAAHNQKLIVSFADDSGACGDPDGVKSDSWYAHGYETNYLPWVHNIVTRYRNNPAIAMWELVNEPTASNGVLRAFFDAVGGKIHAWDPNHLVESGTQPPWAYGGDAGWKYISASPGIDVTSFHEYDMNPGPSPHLASSVADASAIGKPLILGEVGILASSSGSHSYTYLGHSCVSFSQRTTDFSAKLRATFATGVDGVNVWNWMPHNSGTCRMETYPGDSLMTLIHNFPI